MIAACVYVCVCANVVKRSKNDNTRNNKLKHNMYWALCGACVYACMRVLLYNVYERKQMNERTRGKTSCIIRAINSTK